MIRYGLFTEGCGAGEVAGELHLSKIAWIAGILAEIALLFTGALTIALIVRALVRAEPGDAGAGVPCRTPQKTAGLRRPGGV